MIARDKYFYREEGDEQTVESDTYVSISTTKISGRRGLQMSFHDRKQVPKDGSDLTEMIMTFLEIQT